MAPSPPNFALKFLRWFCRKDYIEEIEGDLIELFELRHKKSPSAAKRKFAWSVLRYFRPEFIKAFTGQNSKFLIMYRHNFTLAYRNFSKYKNSFFINLIGLTTGLTCAMLIFLWISDELSVDKFHKKDAHLYQVMLNHEEDGTLRTGPDTQGLLGEAMEQEIPEVKVAVADTDPNWFGESFSLFNDGTHYKAHGKFSGEKYFQLFSFKLKHGSPETVLKDKSSIVISESLAIKLFGTTEGVIGKTIEWHLLQYHDQSAITGIFNLLPYQSTQQFDFVLPFSKYKDIVGDGMHWGNYNALTYVELAAGTNVEQLNKKIANFVKEKVDWSNVTPFFTKFSDIYLHGTYLNGVQAGGRILYVRLFGIVGIFVLIIACINFMNLSTARASRRLKEIGVKKTLGALRVSLITQYITEAICITLLALLLAFVLTYMLLPQFNSLTGKHLSLQLTPLLLLGTLAIALFTGLLAGSYPALYLSGFKPINIFKGRLSNTLGEVWTRKGLVIFQFILSIVMIVSVLVVYKQIDFALNTNLGFNRDGVIKIPAEGKGVDNIDGLLTSLKAVPGVLDATATSHSFVKSGSYTTGVSWPGKDPDAIIKFEQARVYYDIDKTLGITLKAGRSFSRDYADEKSKIMFNEAAIKVMGLKNPIGTTVNMWGNDKEIIGVVKDFNYSTLHDKVGPMLFYFDTEFLQNILIKVKADHIKENINNIAAWYKAYNPGYTFDYEFLDKTYAAQYKTEERVAVLSRYFGGVAIIISCLGLFGLAAFTAERRQKEIGIRKILGAGNITIVSILSADFTKMVGAAIIIGLPISYYLTEIWLSDFAYRIDLKWWYFAAAGAFALLIAWLTVGIQTIKAANINPAESLKDE